MPVGQQFVAIKSKAGSSPIGLVQVHALITRHDELGILGGVCQGGAEQGAPMRIELYLGVLLDRQGVALRGETRRTFREETRGQGLSSYRIRADLHGLSPEWRQTDA